MKSIFSQRSSMSCMKSVKLFIARLCGLFLLFSGSVASAELDPSDLEQLELYLSNINSTLQGAFVPSSATDPSVYKKLAELEEWGGLNYGRLGSIDTYLSQINGHINKNLSALLSANMILIGGTSNESDLGNRNWWTQNNVFSFMRSITNKQEQAAVFLAAMLPAISNELARIANNPVSVSNYVSLVVTNTGGRGVVSPDVLAGNPWWATNSSFVSHMSIFNDAFPDHDLIDTANTLTFPQFMSLWSGRLMNPTPASLTSVSDYWGWDYVRRLSGVNKTRRGYTWFDWIGDKIKSNQVADATYFGRLQSTADDTVDAIDVFRNHFDSYADDMSVWMTNIVAALSAASHAQGDNPWWWTNSAFALVWQQWGNSVPWPKGTLSEQYAQSFPEFASFWSSALAAPVVPDNWAAVYDYWGHDGITPEEVGHYTWFDWIADSIRSNMVLQVASSESNLVEDLVAFGYEEDPDPTNAPLPEYELEQPDIPELEEAITSGEATINDFVDSLPKPGTGGNPEIVVIPEFTVGGIHVREYRASLNSSIVPVAHSVLSFLYGVSLACYIFTLAKSEFSYYATLGRKWGRP